MRTLTVILFIIICTLLYIGCSTTKPQLAQKHLTKAISLDSSIITKTRKEVIVYKDSLRIKDTTIYHVSDSVVLIPKTVLSGVPVIKDTVKENLVDTVQVDSFNKIIADREAYIRQLGSKKIPSPSVIESIRTVETIKEVGHKVLDMVIGMFFGVVFVGLGALGRKVYSFIKIRYKTKASA